MTTITRKSRVEHVVEANDFDIHCEVTYLAQRENGGWVITDAKLRRVNKVMTNGQLPKELCGDLVDDDAWLEVANRYFDERDNRLIAKICEQENERFERAKNNVTKFYR